MHVFAYFEFFFFFCNCIIFREYRYNIKIYKPNCSFPLDCVCPNISKVNSVKYLGIVIDHHLKWNQHTMSLCNKLRESIIDLSSCVHIFLIILYVEYIYLCHRWGLEFASRSLHVGFVVDERGLGRFFTGFLPFPLPQISFHHFSTLISSISFHFTRPCDGASGVVGRHPCYSRTYNIGVHRISFLDPTLCWTRVEDIYLFIFIFVSILHTIWHYRLGMRL